MKAGIAKVKEKQANSRKIDWKALDVVHPDAAGIDIGGREHWVAISPERDEQPVRCFDCFTSDLERMADWLTAQARRAERSEVRSADRVVPADWGWTGAR
jgi:hypothetical protein